MWEEFVSLFYPRVCICCNKVLNSKEDQLCLMCRFTLPKTNYHKTPENPLFNKLSNTAKVKEAFAYLRYQRNGAAQKILRELKYKGNTEIGRLVGIWYGSELADAGFKDKYDIVTVIPLHKNKLKRRGFNQSDIIAQAINESLNAQYAADLLIRQIDTISQTKKQKVQRWQNTLDIFQVNQNYDITQKNILIVDDVITTGATIESAIDILWRFNPKSISVAGLATGQ